MSVTRLLVEDQTGVVDAQLTADNVVVNLTGCSVALVLRGADDVVVTLAGTVSVIDAVQGKVRFSPAVGDLKNAKTPHRAHWRVTDTSSKINFFPSGPGDLWEVSKQGGA